MKLRSHDDYLSFRSSRLAASIASGSKSSASGRGVSAAGKASGLSERLGRCLSECTQDGIDSRRIPGTQGLALCRIHSGPPNDRRCFGCSQ